MLSLRRMLDAGTRDARFERRMAGEAGKAREGSLRRPHATMVSINLIA